MKKMEKTLLKQLYNIHACSGNLEQISDFILDKLEDLDVFVEIDEVGNIYATKGISETYPCLACHIDQIQKTRSKDFVCIESKNIIFGYSPSKNQQEGLGADDKNGIFICLEMLKEMDVLKCIFFVDEEIGCIGSSNCDMNFFSDCRFIIQPDRRGSKDLITEMFCGDVCSEDFITALCAENFGYTKASGTITDVGNLVESNVGISCLNLSCGFYHEHTDKEFTNINDLENCINFIRWILNNVTDTYPFINSYTRYDYYGGDIDYDDYDILDIIYSWNQYDSFEELYEENKECFTSSKSRLRKMYEQISLYNSLV